MNVASGSGSEINIFLFYQQEIRLQLCRLAKWYCKHVSYATTVFILLLKKKMNEEEGKQEKYAIQRRTD